MVTLEGHKNLLDSDVDLGSFFSDSCVAPRLSGGVTNSRGGEKSARGSVPIVRSISNYNGPCTQILPTKPGKRIVLPASYTLTIKQYRKG